MGRTVGCVAVQGGVGCVCARWSVLCAGCVVLGVGVLCWVQGVLCWVQGVLCWVQDVLCCVQGVLCLLPAVVLAFGMTGALVFIILQMILLVDFAHEWNEKW